MNIINFLQTGGYRLKQATFGKMQSAYLEILKAFVSFIGVSDTGNYIITGCKVVGPNITSGMMYIDGELCPFETVVGDATTKIKKNIQLDNLSFKNGSNLPVFRKTTAIVDGAGTMLSDFIRVNEIIPLPNGLVIDPAYGSEPPEPTLLERITALEERPMNTIPVGLVAIWGLPADDIPGGWEEYINLRGKTPVGLDPDYDQSVYGDRFNHNLDVLNYTAGEREHELTVDELPAHSHGGIPTYAAVISGGSGGGNLVNGDAGESDDTGGGLQFNVMNPYRIVHFIRYTGV